MEHKILTTTIKPDFLKLEALINALAEAICTPQQLEKFEVSKQNYIREMFAQLEQQDPQLFEDSPELREMAK